MARTIKLDEFTRDGIFWPDQKSGPWYIVARWAPGADRVECVGLEIWKSVYPDLKDGHVVARGKLEPIAGSDLRQLPLGQLLADLWELQRSAARKSRAHSEMEAHLAERFGNETWLKQATAAAGEATAFLTQPRERKRWDDVDHFEKVAAAYRAAVANHQPPTKAVASHMNCSYSSATKWVARARELGLLAETTPGRPSRGQTTKTKSHKRGTKR